MRRPFAQLREDTRLTDVRVEGRVNLSSPDHISLLVHRTFNVSIPRHHIPSHIWEFEYGPAEEIPAEEKPEEVEGKEEKDEVEDAEEKDEETEQVETGRWVNKSTREPLGGSSRIVEFTVIGYVLLRFLPWSPH